VISVAQAVKKIGIPTKNWPGNCYGVAQAFLKHKLVEGTLQYGHYFGPISPKSKPFGGRRFTHHAWILNDEEIIDPTRWVFEAVKPYIYVGPISDDYDFGGNRLHKDHEKPPPPFNPEERVFNLRTMPLVCKTMVKVLLKSPSDKVSFGQTMWLGNLALDTLGEETRTLYKWLVENKLGAVIPIDNRRHVLGDK